MGERFLHFQLNRNSNKPIKCTLESIEAALQPLYQKDPHELREIDLALLIQLVDVATIILMTEGL